MMKHLKFLAAVLLAVSCNVKEMPEAEETSGAYESLYAETEGVQPSDSKAYVDGQLRVLWHADDRISVFRRYTFNQEYRFEGQTGDNAGEFKKMETDALDITGTTLSEVLNTGRNPIEDFLDEVIQEDTEASVQDTWKTYWQTLVLEDCGFDLAKVEAKIREYKGGGIAKAMRPFRELMEALPAGTSTWTKDKLLDVVRG